MGPPVSALSECCRCTVRRQRRRLSSVPGSGAESLAALIRRHRRRNGSYEKAEVLGLIGEP